jgi:4-amino-4-deoxy-L-arabinose transferase-like glycosyltransferase
VLVRPGSREVRGVTALPTFPGALPPRPTALLLALTAGLLLFRLGATPLVGPDEARYARVAVEMHRSGDHVTPTLQGRPWMEKPVLYYWLAGVGFSWLGETETAARLPSVGAGLLMVGVTALVGARLFGAVAGLHAGFVLATAVLPFAYGKAAAMDMLLAATVTAAVGLLALRIQAIAGSLAVPVAYAFMALATLAKGPIGVLLPGLIVVAYAAATRDLGVVRRLLSPAGTALFLVVAAPWYLLIWRAQGQAFVDEFFLNHNLQRFTSTIHNHPGAPWYYVPVLLGGFWPWSGLLLPALGGTTPRRSRADLFVLLWLLAPLVFFSAAGSKLPGYILPCLPPLAILMGRAAARLTAGEGAGPFGARSVAVVGLVLGALVATTPFLLWRMAEPLWASALPFSLWSVVVAFAFSRRVARDPAGAIALLRVGAAGGLLLLALAAPDLLARRESGRALFVRAAGREVLAWGAWRTAWMAGYFYNDGKVREVRDLPEIMTALAQSPTVLVLCGPSERRRLQRLSTVSALTLAEGPRENALLQLTAHADGNRRPGSGSRAE